MNCVQIAKICLDQKLYVYLDSKKAELKGCQDKTTDFIDRLLVRE